MISRTHRVLPSTTARSQRQSTAKRSTQRTKLFRGRHQICETAMRRIIATHMERVRRASVILDANDIGMTLLSGAKRKVKMTLSATSHWDTTSSTVLFNTAKAAVGFPPPGNVLGLSSTMTLEINGVSQSRTVSHTTMWCCPSRSPPDNIMPGCHQNEMIHQTDDW